MSSETVTLPVTLHNLHGLHARPAAKLVELCNNFGSEVMLEKDGNKINGKNILDVMVLAADQDTEIFIHITGHDADDAAQAIKGLIDRNFDLPE